MALNKTISKLRKKANITQEQFSEIFNVSRQAVQKWENGTSTPELSKIIEIANYFDVSLDYLVLNRDTRTLESISYGKVSKPHYEKMHDWEFYASYLDTEYTQCCEEGLDIEMYKDIFSSVSKLPKNEIKKELGDTLFKIVTQLKQKENFNYVEPSNLEDIKKLRQDFTLTGEVDYKKLRKKIEGAWYGRISGCMLGKTVEGIRTDEFVPLLSETGNFPLHRYILRKDMNEEIYGKYTYNLRNTCYADEIDSMPVDDDTNYMVLAQVLIERYGKDFTAQDVAQNWIHMQPKTAYCTAERVAFRNFVNGYEPPYSATYKNPFREWIGAQIRGDYYGYINPGDPEMAADMAFKDASISHTKNGIYGEMFAAAMISAAAKTDDFEKIILCGLSKIPSTSRLYEDVLSVIEGYKNGIDTNQAFTNIHQKYDEYTEHGWCHTIPNAMIVAASLLYGENDFSKSICLAVQTGFDTDCNGATVGSILGMKNGIDSIPKHWIAPFNDTLNTMLSGLSKVKISECIDKTLNHIQK